MSDDDLNVTISEDGPSSSAAEDLLNVVVEDSFSSDDLDAQVSEDDLDVSTQEDSLTVDVGDMGLLYHNRLSGLQGGDVDLDEFYHLSSDNNDNLLVLVGGGDTDLHYHSADRDRANHTGTQLLATISDAGSMAYEDADDYLPLTGGVLSGTLQINVPTANQNGLILQSTDDDSTKYLLEARYSGGGAGVLISAFNLRGQTILKSNNGNVTLTSFADNNGIQINPSGSYLQLAVGAWGAKILASNQGNTLGIGIAPVAGQRTTIKGFDASHKVLVVQGAVGHSANLQEWQNSSGLGQLAIAGNMRDFILDTVVGTKFGTATNQKLAFYNATPIVKQAGVGVDAASIHAALVNLGLIAA